MLGFIVTDAKVSQPVLQMITQEIADLSFNSITVDGDTSTNDSFVVVATGKSGQNEIDNIADPRYEQLKAMLGSLALELAQAIVRDGEGATKFITIQVDNAESRAEARQVAYAIAHSPLVKTAFSPAIPTSAAFSPPSATRACRIWTPTKCAFTWAMCWWPSTAAAPRLHRSRRPNI